MRDAVRPAIRVRTAMASAADADSLGRSGRVDPHHTTDAAIAVINNAAGDVGWMDLVDGGDQRWGCSKGVDIWASPLGPKRSGSKITLGLDTCAAGLLLYWALTTERGSIFCALPCRSQPHTTKRANRDSGGSLMQSVELIDVGGKLAVGRKEARDASRMHRPSETPSPRRKLQGTLPPSGSRLVFTHHLACSIDPSS